MRHSHLYLFARATDKTILKTTILTYLRVEPNKVRAEPARCPVHPTWERPPTMALPHLVTLKPAFGNAFKSVDSLGLGFRPRDPGSCAGTLHSFPSSPLHHGRACSEPPHEQTQKNKT